MMHTKFIVVCLLSNQLLMVGMTTCSIVVTLPRRIQREWVVGTCLLLLLISCEVLPKFIKK
jgi:hypothetical protein